MTTGEIAERKVTDYLEGSGFQIIARNWRRPHCEIDIIARKSGKVHFVEVKYRSKAEYGSGFDYVHRPKQQRLIRAAESWCVESGWEDDYQIDVASVSGRGFQIDYLENAVLG